MKVKCVLTEHASTYAKKLIHPFEEKYLASIFSSVSKLITVSKGLKDELRKYTSKQIDVVFNILSLESYNPKHDRNKNTFRFFSLGLDAHTKGMDILIHSYVKSSIFKQSELKIAGLSEGDIIILENILNEYNSPQNIQIFGKLSRQEVVNHMYNSDCFVLASRYETFGIVNIEAMYFGKPVIASTTGGPDSYITDKTGLLVPVNDIKATTNALEYIYHNINEYNINFIKNYTIENFSAEVISKKIINIYKDLLS